MKRDSDGPYLNVLSSGTSSRLELDTGDIDVSEYTTLSWAWKIVELPAVEWEMDKKQDDYVLRIELEYNFKGSWMNPLNILRKGLIKTIFMGYPPVLKIDYVWSNQVPVDTSFTSPNDKLTTIIPIESGSPFHTNWVYETRDIAEDLDDLVLSPNSLRLKRIRIFSDTETMPSVAEGGLKYLRIIKGSPAGK